MRLIDADALPKYNGTALNAVDVARAVETAPTIDPVKHGKWVLITKDYIDPQGYMCSVCGRTIKYYGIPALLLEMYPYCNCGAKMDGERSEE